MSRTWSWSSILFQTNLELFAYMSVCVHIYQPWKIYSWDKIQSHSNDVCVCGSNYFRCDSSQASIKWMLAVYASIQGVWNIYRHLTDGWMAIDTLHYFVFSFSNNEQMFRPIFFQEIKQIFFLGSNAMPQILDIWVNRARSQAPFSCFRKIDFLLKKTSWCFSTGWKSFIIPWLWLLPASPIFTR